MSKKLQSAETTAVIQPTQNLLKEVEDLRQEVKKLKSRKKYGLVWEDKAEDVVERCRAELPILKEVKNKAIAGDAIGPTNILIEGDNYHALSVLNYTHKGKFDAIYADPPYNTGAKNWLYNNDYVDGNDAFRHSKWLSFMKKRLVLAKSLLKEEGIIVITIDDYEVATLKLLMNEIFGEENHLGTVVIKNNPSGRSTTSGFAIAHEYALFYAKTSSAKIGRLRRSEDQTARYKERDEIGNFEWVNFRARYSTISPRLQYPLFIKKDGSDFRIPSLEWDSINRIFKLLEKPKSGELIKYPIDESNQLRCWKWGIETVKRQKDLDMGVRLDQKKQPTVYVKARMRDEGMLPLTWWDKTEYSATAYGTNLLSKIMSNDNRFEYPKSLYAVMDTILVMSENKNAKVLDFFAGSGTTGHAVLQLNKEDGGNRNFILCTNNENKIAEEVCYSRISKVINGYTNTNGEEVVGLGGSLKYFRTVFVNAEPNDKNKEALTRQATEMLCVREDAFDLVKETEAFKIFKNQKKHIGIIFNEDVIPAFKKEIIKIGGIWDVYIFSLSGDTYEDEFEDMKQKITVGPIPEAILRAYRNLFKA